MGSSVIEPFNLIGIDPGGTTGIAHSTWAGNVENPTVADFNYSTHQMGPVKHHRTLYDYLCFYCENAVIQPIIICESFEFRQNYERNKVELISREYIGIIELVAQQTGCKLIMQSASMGKSFVPDNKLKLSGILVEPPHPNRHKNDALRHLVRYQVVNMGIHAPITDNWKVQ